jgi:hypothetical protein
MDALFMKTMASNIDIEDMDHTLTLKSATSQNDFIWLTPNVIAEFSQRCSKKICLLNDSFELDTFIIQSNDRQGVTITNNFSESLYLLYMFLAGDLFGAPLSHKVNYMYFANMHNVLMELCIRGVYVVEGVEPIHGKILSQCAFVVFIRDEMLTHFIYMLETLHEHHIEVDARRIKSGKVILQYSMVKNFKTVTQFHVDTSHICDRFDYCGGITTCQSSQLEDSNFSIWHIQLWSQCTFDYVHVEDMLLNLWIKYNSLYGYANYDLFAL